MSVFAKLRPSRANVESPAVETCVPLSRMDRRVKLIESISIEESE